MTSIGDIRARMLQLLDELDADNAALQAEAFRMGGKAREIRTLLDGTDLRSSIDSSEQVFGGLVDIHEGGDRITAGVAGLRDIALIL